MYVTTGAPERAGWEVLFVYKGKIRRKKFSSNFPGALAYYAKVIAKGPALKGATLRCVNMAFPPPPELQPHTKLVRKKGRKKPVEVRVRPLWRLNIERGVWWCPYCMKLRTFVERTRLGKRLFCCPMCGISHKDWSVGKWNPIVWERISPREPA